MNSAADTNKTFELSVNLSPRQQAFVAEYARLHGVRERDALALVLYNALEERARATGGGSALPTWHHCEVLPP